MRKFFATIKNIFAIQELRSRILTTMGLLLVFRLGSFIVLPGIDASRLTGQLKGIFGLLDIFLGGAFSNVSIFALGVMPYISASIAVQLLTVAVPYFQKLQREGQSGRKRLSQLTKMLTLVVGMIQALSYLATTVSDEAILVSKPLFLGMSLFILPAGTMVCMWIGDRITDKGIGNGVSMLIMIGIVSSLPGAFFEELVLRGSRGTLVFIIELLILFLIVITVVMFTQAIRKIPLQYAKQMISGSVYSSQRQYIPFKLNTSGVMPIIFSQVLMFLPALLTNLFANKSEVAAVMSRIFSDFTTWQYNVTFAVLIIVFTYFYTAITVNPMQIADDMKRSNSFIPGIKPGKPTAAFLDHVLSRITLPGSLFLAFIAILPGIAHLLGLSRSFSRFFGGTSLLIMVGVVLDTLQQIESYLLMHHYDHMMKSGRIKGRTQNNMVGA
jgi:preprotein translocase subunit SecY